MLDGPATRTDGKVGREGTLCGYRVFAVVRLRGSHSAAIRARLLGGSHHGRRSTAHLLVSDGSR